MGNAKRCGSSCSGRQVLMYFRNAHATRNRSDNWGKVPLKFRSFFCTWLLPTPVTFHVVGMLSYYQVDEILVVVDSHALIINTRIGSPLAWLIHLFNDASILKMICVISNRFHSPPIILLCVIEI